MPTAHSSLGSQRGPHSTLEARWAPKAVLGPGPNLLIEGLGCFPFKQPEMAQSHHRWEAEARISCEGLVEKANSCGDMGQGRGAQAGGSRNGPGRSPQAWSLWALAASAGEGKQEGDGRRSPALGGRAGF